MDACLWCDAPLDRKPTGRPRRFCCDAHRKAFARARIPGGLDPLPAPAAIHLPPSEDRLAFIVCELQAHQRDCSSLARRLPPNLAWRSAHIADAIGHALDYTALGKD